MNPAEKDLRGAIGHGAKSFCARLAPQQNLWKSKVDILWSYKVTFELKHDIL